MAKIKDQDRTPEINQYLADQYFKNHKDRIYSRPVNKYIVVGDRMEEVKSIVVYEFEVGDVDDPDLYAAQPLCEWEYSEKGKWIMKNACDTPTWYRINNPATFGHQYQIRAKLAGAALTEWLLRYGK